MENELDRMAVAAARISMLRNSGYEVEMCTDFEEATKLSLLAGRKNVMPTFAVAPAHLTEGGAFWLFLKSNGEYVAVVAAIFQPLGRENLADFLRRSYRNQFPHPSGETILKVAEPIYEISGNLVYIGELARREGFKGRRQELAAFMKVLQILIAQKWDFDATYAFIPERHYEARLDRVYSFNETVEHPMTWSEPPPFARSNDEYFLTSTRSQVAHSILIEASKFWAQCRE